MSELQRLSDLMDSNGYRRAYSVFAYTSPHYFTSISIADIYTKGLWVKNEGLFISVVEYTDGFAKEYLISQPFIVQYKEPLL